MLSRSITTIEVLWRSSSHTDLGPLNSPLATDYFGFSPPRLRHGPKPPVRFPTPTPEIGFSFLLWRPKLISSDRRSLNHNKNSTRSMSFLLDFFRSDPHTNLPEERYLVTLFRHRTWSHCRHFYPFPFFIHLVLYVFSILTDLNHRITYTPITVSHTGSYWGTTENVSTLLLLLNLSSTTPVITYTTHIQQILFLHWYKNWGLEFFYKKGPHCLSKSVTTMSLSLT